MCQRINLDIYLPGHKERWGGEVGKWEVIRGFIVTSLLQYHGWGYWGGAMSQALPRGQFHSLLLATA